MSVETLRMPENSEGEIISQTAEGSLQTPRPFGAVLPNLSNPNEIWPAQSSHLTPEKESQSSSDSIWSTQSSIRPESVSSGESDFDEKIAQASQQLNDEELFKKHPNWRHSVAGGAGPAAPPMPPPVPPPPGMGPGPGPGPGGIPHGPEIDWRRVQNPILREYLSFTLQAKYLNIATDEIFADPNVLDRYQNGDDSQFQEITNKRIQARAMHLAYENPLVELPIGTRPGEREPDSDPDKELIRITTPYGEREIQWPKEDAESIHHMRTILVNIQSTKEADGGDVNRLALQELAYAISALRTMGPERHKDWQAKRELGERMYEEFVTTLVVHGLFLQYEKPSNADAINGLLSSLTARQLNFLLKGNKVPEDTKLKLARHDGLNVKQLMDWYDIHSDEYLVIREQEQLEKFRQEARASMKPREGENLSDEDRITSQMLGERMWRMLSRRVIKDRLVDSKLKTPIEATPANKENGNISFLGVTSGADYDLNRLENFKEYVYTQIGPSHPFVELLEGWDFGSNDFLTDVPTTIEGFYKDVLFNKYARGIDNSNKDELQQAYNRAEADAREVAKYLFGNSNLIETTDEIGEPKYSWKRRADLDITKFNYDGTNERGEVDPHIAALLEGTGVSAQIDFNILGEQPMVTWAYRKISLAEKARGVLIATQEAFLREPTSEALYKLKNAFAYQGATQFTTMGKIIEDWGNFLLSGEGTKIGLLKSDRAMVESSINHAALHLGLESEEVYEAVKSVLGDDLLSNLLIINDYFRTDKFLTTLLREIFLGILKEIGKG